MRGYIPPRNTASAKPLPSDLKGSLPTVEELEHDLRSGGGDEHTA